VIKPYTCHQCGTTFDLLPPAFPAPGGGFRPPPAEGKIKVKCPGCYAAGFTGCPGTLNPPGKGDMVYTIDLETLKPV